MTSSLRHRIPPLAALAAVLVIVLLGSTLPSPLYAVYAAELGLSRTAITALVATYAAGVLLALLTCGHLSDHVGRKPVAAGAIALSALSDAAFALGSAAYPGLLLGRLLSGFAIGVATSTIAAHLIESAAPGQRARAGQISGIATMAGGGGGALLAGALAQWAPAPTLVPFAVNLALLAIAAVLLALVPETVAPPRRARPRAPRMMLPPAGTRQAFAGAGCAAFCAFAVLGLCSALAGTFLKVALDSPNRVLAGAVPFLLGVTATALPPLLRGLGPRAMMRVGLAGLAPALSLFVVGIAAQSMALFVVAVAVAGAMFGAAFQGGLRALQGIEHARQGELYSSFYTAAYAGMALPVVGAGLVADRLSLTATVAAFSVAVGALAIVSLAFTREPS